MNAKDRKMKVGGSLTTKNVQGSGSSAGMTFKGCVGNGTKSDACKGAQGMSDGGKKKGGGY